MSKMATLLGKTSDATRYESLATNATQVFHSTFYNPSFHAYGGDDGAVQSLTIPALVIDSAPPDLTKTLLTDLQTDLANPGQGQPPYTLRVGAVTSKALLDVLSSNGLHDSALRMATQTAEPSWGWWWTQNATTCWEAWPGGMIPGDSGGTHNHIFLVRFSCTRSIHGFTLNSLTVDVNIACTSTSHELTTGGMMVIVLHDVLCSAAVSVSGTGNTWWVLCQHRLASAPSKLHPRSDPLSGPRRSRQSM
eukprot:m.83033 g.83033  ORF g.83033 m.83033 type:complete len:249 (+) comp9514_c0_seq2:53-799(+)